MIREATPDQLRKLVGAHAAHVERGWVMDDESALGGFCRFEGRLWAFYDVLGAVDVRVFYAIRSVLEAQTEDVFVPCNQAYATAPRLLALLGFEPTEEMRFGMVVWKWPSWR